MKLSAKPRKWLLKINPLFIFSLSTYGITLAGWWNPSDQIHAIIGIVNFYDAHNIFYVCLFVATIYSLVQNTQHVFDLTGKLDWFRILGRFGTELTIMLLGTLASILAFLTLFATRPDIIISVIIFVVIGVVLNASRSRVVNFYDNTLEKIIHDRQQKRGKT